MESLNNKYIRCTTEDIYTKSLLILSIHLSLIISFKNFKWYGPDSVFILINNIVYHDYKLYYTEYDEISYEYLFNNY